MGIFKRVSERLRAVHMKDDSFIALVSALVVLGIGLAVMAAAYWLLPNPNLMLVGQSIAGFGAVASLSVLIIYGGDSRRPKPWDEVDYVFDEVYYFDPPLVTSCVPLSGGGWSRQSFCVGKCIKKDSGVYVFHGKPADGTLEHIFYVRRYETNNTARIGSHNPIRTRHK